MLPFNLCKRVISVELLKVNDAGQCKLTISILHKKRLLGHFHFDFYRMASFCQYFSL
uniref:Uncharacterized protein n=1 Tax=Anguilla anguilla TaxID=7936 RepID=A0A0E9RTU0_ANGAN